MGVVEVVIKRKKIEKCVSEYALKLLEGFITIEEFLFYFEENPNSFAWAVLFFTSLSNISSISNVTEEK